MTPQSSPKSKISPALVLMLLLPSLGLLVAVAMLLAENTSSAPAAPDSEISSRSSAPLLGQVAEDFTVRTLDNDTLRLSDFSGRVVFLNFWATWCPPCVRELPALQEFARQQGDQGAVVLASNNYETLEEITAYLDENAIALPDVPVLLDEDSRIYRGFGVFQLPTTYIIGPDGVVSQVRYGELTVEEMYGYLENFETGDG